MSTSRKDFLKTLAFGSAASAFAAFSKVDQDFAAKLSANNSQKLPERNDYSLNSGVVYLNHGSIGTIPKLVQEAHRNYLDACESNPWLHMWGDEWVEPVEKARLKAANFVNGKSSEISFPHNTTEIYNLLALGMKLGKGDEVLFCNFNHAGASIPFNIHSKKNGYKVKIFDIPVSSIPSLNKADLLNLYDENISSSTKLVVLPHIDNTFGIRQPIKEIVDLARAKGVEFISLDAAQTMGMLPIDVKQLGVDVIGTSAHKWIQAPKGVSFAWFSEKAQNEINPVWVTWGQNRWEDSARKFEDYGTRNLAEVLTLGNAIDFQSSFNADDKAARLKSLWDYAKLSVSESNRIEWASPESWEMSGSLFLIKLMDKTPSEVAEKLFKNHGLVFRPFDQYSTIRISPNLFNTKEELDLLFQRVV